MHFTAGLMLLEQTGGCRYQQQAVTHTVNTTLTGDTAPYTVFGIRFMWKYSGTEYWAENKPDSILRTMIVIYSQVLNKLTTVL